MKWVSNKTARHALASAIALLGLAGEAAANGVSRGATPEANALPFPMAMIAEGTGWKLIETDATESGNTQLWSITRTGLRTVPLSDAQKRIVQAALDDTTGSLPSTSDLETPLYFSHELLAAMESPDFPRGYEKYIEDDTDGYAKGGFCSWSERSEREQYSFTENLWDINLPFSGGSVTGGLTGSLPVTGAADLTFNYSKRKCAGVTVGFRYDGASGTGTLAVNGRAALAASVAYNPDGWAKEWKIAHPNLGTVTFWIGPVPVRLKFSLPIYAGAAFNASLAGQLAAELDASASGTFTFTCVKYDCSGHSDFDDQFDFVGPTASVELNASARAHLRAMARMALYDDAIAFVEGGAEAYARGALWGYIGNACGDADGDGNNETVRALTADLWAGYRFAYGYGLATEESDPKYVGGREWHLGWIDILGDGGSTALAPMVRGPGTVIRGEQATYTVSMRPCYKYADHVTLTVSPFEQTVIIDPKGGSATVVGSFPQVGTTPLRVVATHDAAGRDLRTALVRNVQVNTDVPVPAVPTNLAATLTATGIALRWNDNSHNENGFRVERRVNGGAWALLANVSTNATTAIDGAPVAGAIHAYRVRAQTSENASEWSNVASIQVPAAGPAAPSNLVATYDRAQRRMTVDWTDNSNGETGFTLEFSYGGSAFGPVTGTLGPNATSWTVSGNIPAGMYRYRVRANDAAGSSAWSNVATVNVIH